MERFGPDSHTIGIFSLRAESASVTVDAPDGAYENLIDGGRIVVKNGQVSCGGSPIIFTLAR